MPDTPVSPEPAAPPMDPEFERRVVRFAYRWCREATRDEVAGAGPAATDLWRWVCEDKEKAVDEAEERIMRSLSDPDILAKLADGEKWRVLVKHAGEDRLLMAHMASAEKRSGVRLVDPNPFYSGVDWGSKPSVSVNATPRPSPDTEGGT